MYGMVWMSCDGLPDINCRACMLPQVASHAVATLQAALGQGQGQGRGEGRQEGSDVSTQLVVALAAAAADLPQPPYRLLKVAAWAGTGREHGRALLTLNVPSDVRGDGY